MAENEIPHYEKRRSCAGVRPREMENNRATLPGGHGHYQSGYF